MKTITLQATTGQDGLLDLKIPAPPNQTFEVLLVLQPVEVEMVDALGYPIGFFDETYGSFADDPLDLGAPLPLPVRESIE